MALQNPNDPPLLDDLDRHYLRGTRPQEFLPFSVRVRRRHRWWPGPERHGRLIDRLILVAILAPGIIWAAVSFGWLPVMFIVSEIVLIRLTIYRVMTETFLE